MLPLPLAHVVSLFTTGSVTVEDFASAGFDSEGNPTQGSATTSTIQASIQPVLGRELEQIPEGLRGKETVWVFTTSRLKTTTENGEQANVVRYQRGGDATYTRYRIHSAEDWTLQAGHYRCLGVKVAG